MNNPKFRQNWILDELKINPTIGFSYLFSKYLEKFSKSEVTFSKDWNKANEALKQYQFLINSAKLEQSIETEKEAIKRNILTKLHAMEILTDIAIKGEKDTDRRNAIETLAKLDGWNAPTKQELNILTEQPPIFGSNPLDKV